MNLNCKEISKDSIGRYSRKFKSINFIILVLILFLCKNVYGVSIYKNLDKRENVEPDKIWTINFNKNVDIKTINNYNIQIKDHLGAIQDLEFLYDSKNKNIIKLKNKNLYNQGEQYSLLIQNLNAEDGKELLQPAKMEFIIKKYSKESEKTVENLKYELIGSHTYEMTYVIKISGLENDSCSVTYNIGKLSTSPYEKEIGLKAEGNGIKLVKESNGEVKAVISKVIKKGEKLEYKIIRTIETSGIEYKGSLKDTKGNYNNFKDYKKYTSSEDKIESNNAAIIKKSKELFKNTSNPYEKALKAFEYVNMNITYDANYRNKGALSALNTKRGVCEDYSDLFVALLRASGVPARVVQGYWIQDYFEDDILKCNAGESIDIESYRHAWPEYYLPEYGWIPVEPTFTYTFNDEPQVNYDYFSKLNCADHILQGYYENNSFTGAIYYSYQGSRPFKLERSEYVKVVR